MIRVIRGDCREKLRGLPDQSVHCVVTSPPYWGLRDYGVDGQLGLEETPEQYVETMVDVFREVRRVLRDDGTLWLNLGDSYVGPNNTNNGGNANFGSQPGRSMASAKDSWLGLPAKNLVGIPWRVAFALQADGWWLRQDIIWSKPNPMPESVTDRCTKAHEYLFMLSKSARYYFDAEAIAEEASDPGGRAGYAGYSARAGAMAREPSGNEKPGMEAFNAETRNKRSVWTVATQPFSEAHFATFPPALIEPCIKAGCPKSGTVLDPFGGAGTTGLVADRLGRDAILIELNPEYADMTESRIRQDAGLFADIGAEVA